MSGNFDRIAPYYNKLSKLVFGNSIHNAQIQFLDKVPPQSDVLIIGGGSGKFLREFLKTIHIKRVLYLESSVEMIRLSKEAITGIEQGNQVEFRVGNVSDLKEHEVFDVVATHFFLDVFSGKELMSLMVKLNSRLKPEGIWLFSDFRISGNKIHRLWQNLLLKTMYLFFKITAGLKNTKLENFNIFFDSLQFIKLEEKFFRTGMICSAVYKKPYVVNGRRP